MQDIIFFIKQNSLLSGAWLLVVALLIAVELRERLWGPKSLSSGQLTLALNQADALLIDIRPQADYSKGHITMADNFNISAINDAAVLAKRIENKQGANKQRPIIIACKDGIQSKQIAFKLQGKGLNNVSYLQGGMLTWQSEGLPVITN